MTTPARRTSSIVAVLAIALAVAACGTTASGSRSAVPAAPPATASTPGTASTTAPSDDPLPPAASDAEPTSAPAVELSQAWATAELTDVASGETFRIADLAGRPMLIETMAIWCSNCYAQQQDAYAGIAALGTTDLVYLLIDVDPNESAAALAAYRDDNGFTGRYVVATQDLARALAADFGDQILNPPSIPMITIDTSGTVTLTPYGQHERPDEIVALAESIGA